jgi:hypothetical protein
VRLTVEAQEVHADGTPIIPGCKPEKFLLDPLTLCATPATVAVESRPRAPFILRTRTAQRATGGPCVDFKIVVVSQTADQQLYAAVCTMQPCMQPHGRWVCPLQYPIPIVYRIVMYWDVSIAKFARSPKLMEWDGMN